MGAGRWITIRTKPPAAGGLCGPPDKRYSRASSPARTPPLASPLSRSPRAPLRRRGAYLCFSDLTSVTDGTSTDIRWRKQDLHLAPNMDSLRIVAVAIGDSVWDSKSRL